MVKSIQQYVILIGGVDAFFFIGTEEEVDNVSIRKAMWAGAAGRKRIASPIEIKTGIINYCQNHPNFNTISVYNCMCGECLVKRRVKKRKETIEILTKK